MEDPELIGAEVASLTVVVVTLIGGAALTACLEALASQDVAILVVGRHASPADQQIVLPVPQLRLHALARAQTRFVGFVEDSCRPDPDWCAALTKELMTPNVAAAAGPVLVSPALKSRYYALGLSEYGAYDPETVGLTPGASSVAAMTIPGLAFAIDRDVVWPLMRDNPLGLVEHEMVERLQLAGWAARLSTGAAVTYAAPHVQGARLATRFHHGRLYAAARFAPGDWGSRLVRAAMTPALPFVLTHRALAGGARRRSPGVAMWLMLMHVAWSMGELCGYLTASAGGSLKNWS